MKSEAELRVLREMPERYGEIAYKVDLAMKLSDRPCVGDGCDEDRTCARHRRIPGVVIRYLRLKKLKKGI